MAQNYKQRIHEALWAAIDAHPRARVSDTLAALNAVVEEIWHQLPPPKNGKRQIDKCGRSYMQDAVTKRYRLA